MTLHQRVVQAKLVIDQQYDQPLSLDQLSDSAHFSKYHFLRLFRKLYKVTPHQYLTRKRIEAARQQLTHSDFSIADIGFRVGFQGVSHFNVTFRKWVGTHPTQYREKTRQQLEQAQTQPATVIPYCFAQSYCTTE